MSAQRSPELAPEFSTRVLHDVPMSKHTSWHAGGPADMFFAPRDSMDLASFVRQLPMEVPLMWIGLGSNLLVRDGGIRGAVISTQGALGALERQSATRIRAEAGVPCAHRKAAELQILRVRGFCAGTRFPSVPSLQTGDRSQSRIVAWNIEYRNARLDAHP